GVLDASRGEVDACPRQTALHREYTGFLAGGDDLEHVGERYVPEAAFDHDFTAASPHRRAEQPPQAGSSLSARRQPLWLRDPWQCVATGRAGSGKARTPLRA